MPLSQFAYIQTRLQARYGDQPNETAWRRLQGIGSFTHFLQMARSTPLRAWLLDIGPHSDSHAIEKSLRRQLRHQIDEVAAWQPMPWRAAVRWCAMAIDLPPLQHLLNGAAAPSWVQEDPRLKFFTHELQPLRLQALRESAYAPLLHGTERGLTLNQAWHAHWESLWPHPLKDSERQALALFSRTLAIYYQSLAAGEARDSLRAREWLMARLRLAFRRHTRQPATVFIYLALTLLNLERLRALLIRLTLFPAQVQPQ